MAPARLDLRLLCMAAGLSAALLVVGLAPGLAAAQAPVPLPRSGAAPVPGPTGGASGPTAPGPTAGQPGAGPNSAVPGTMTALVVPIWRTRFGVLPLDDRNAWRDAWGRFAQTGSDYRLILVQADPADQRLITAEQAFVGDVAAINRLAERYPVQAVAVVVLSGDVGGPLAASGTLYNLQTGARTALAAPQAPTDAQIEAAAREQLAQMEHDWRLLAAAPTGAGGTLDAAVPIRQMSDWVQVRQRLAGVAAVKRVTVRQLETERASISIEHSGSPEELQRLLATAGLALTRDGDGWRIAPR